MIRIYPTDCIKHTKIFGARQKLIFVESSSVKHSHTALSKMPTASLFDLCLKTIDTCGVDYHELPDELSQAINNYKEYPVRQIYGEGYNSTTIFKFATAAGYPLDEGDTYWINNEPKSWLFENWGKLMTKFMDVFFDIMRTKQKIALFSLYLQFFHENPVLLTFLSKIHGHELLWTSQERFKAVLTVEAPKSFGDKDHKRFEELWGYTLHKGSVKIHLKRTQWKDVHKSVENFWFHKIFLREFPSETDIEGTFQRKPYDVFKSIYKFNYLDNVMRAVRDNVKVYGWEYDYRHDQFGYWWDQWYYEGELIYEEGYNDYNGKFTSDWTIGQETGESNTPIAFAGFLFT